MSAGRLGPELSYRRLGECADIRGRLGALSLGQSPLQRVQTVFHRREGKERELAMRDGHRRGDLSEAGASQLPGQIQVGVVGKGPTGTPVS